MIIEYKYILVVIISLASNNGSIPLLQADMDTMKACEAAKALLVKYIKVETLYPPFVDCVKVIKEIKK